MSRFDSLPADQGAVLSLLLTQQKSYGEIAQALDLSAAAVSERAYAALSSLAEPEKAPASRRRAEICDYLLGQQDGDAAGRTRASLTRSASDRAWARAASAPLAAIAGSSLPPIPGAEPPGAAQPSRSEGSTAGAPDSRSRGGFFLIAGVCLLVAVGAGFGLGRATGGSDPAPSDPAANSAANVSAQNATEIARAALKAPAGAPAPKAVGFAGISAQSDARVLSVVAKGLPKAPSGSQYGIWLTANGKAAVWLGYLQSVGSGGVGLQGTLNGDPKAYSGVLLTLERSSPAPTNPSKTYLVGALQFTAG
jgi:Anti-sigma-K factor rskA